MTSATTTKNQFNSAWAGVGVNSPSPEWPLPSAKGRVLLPKEEGAGRPSTFGEWALAIKEECREIPSPDSRSCYEYLLIFPDGNTTEFHLDDPDNDRGDVYGVYGRQVLGNSTISYVEEIGVVGEYFLR